METNEIVREGIDTTIQTYVDLLAAFYAVQNLSGLKFALKVDENIATLEKELEPLNTILNPTDEFLDFADKIQKEAGNDPEKIKLLEDENEELVNYRKEQIATAKEMLSDAKQISLKKIYYRELPKEITAAQIKALKPILKK